MRKTLLLIAALFAAVIMFVFTAYAEEGVLRLPASLTMIEESAFERIGAEVIELPEGLKQIEARAFADIPGLKTVWIPGSVESIGDEAFGDASGVSFFGESGSYAQKWAQEHGLRFVTKEALAIAAAIVALTAVLALLGVQTGDDRRILAGGYANADRAIDRKRRPEMYPLAWDFP